MTVKSVFLVLTSAISLDGVIAKAGELIEVVEADAADLLRRGKARLAAAEDGVHDIAEGAAEVIGALDPSAPIPSIVPAIAPVADTGADNTKVKPA